MIEAPNPDWLPFLKVLFGYLAFLTMAFLAAVLALGKVEEKTSFGLQYLLGAFTFMSGVWAQWAFSTAMTPVRASDTPEVKP